MRNSQRLGIAGAATALGLLGFVGAASAADIAPEGYYQPAPRYGGYVERAPVYAQRRQVEIQDDGECRYIVRRSVDEFGNERERQVQDCNQGRGPVGYDEDVDPDEMAAPRPPAVVDPDDAY